MDLEMSAPALSGTRQLVPLSSRTPVNALYDPVSLPSGAVGKGVIFMFGGSRGLRGMWSKWR
jgi:hypothetical protein